MFQVPKFNHRGRVHTQEKYSQTDPVSTICQNSLSKKQSKQVTVGDYLNKTPQNTFTTRKFFIQKHRPTVPPIRYSPRNIISKNQILLRRASRTMCRQDKRCNNTSTNRSTSLENRPMFPDNRQQNKRRYRPISRDRCIVKDKSIMARNDPQNKSTLSLNRPSKPPSGRNLPQNRSPSPQARCKCPKTVARPVKPPPRPISSSERPALLPHQKMRSMSPLLSSKLCKRKSTTSFFPTNTKLEKASRTLLKNIRQIGRSDIKNKDARALFQRVSKFLIR